MADKTFTIRDGITVNEEVLLSIAGIGALEVEGVDSLNGGITGKTITRIGLNKLQRAIRIVRDENDKFVIQLIISVRYGMSIIKVTEAVQEKVKSTVENMTDIKVKAVDVKVSSVNVSEQKNR